MSSGGGGDPLKQIESTVRDTGRKWRNDPDGEFVRFLSNVFTRGAFEVKRNKDGSRTGAGAGGGFDVGFGQTVRGANEGARELSGANKARAEAYKTADMERTMEAKTELDRQTNELAAYRADLAASRGAQGIRDTAMARASGQRYGGTKLGTDDEDVLGL